MRNLKIISGYLIIVVIITFSVMLGSDIVLTPKYYEGKTPWPTTQSYNQFYRMEKNTIDVLFFGSSYCVNAFNPQELYEARGIRSYNLGSEQQSVFLSYFWLKEALRFHNPKVVILEPRFLFTIHPENPVNTTEGLTRKCLDPMRISPVKLEAVHEICSLDKSQTTISYFFKNIRFHSRWKSLSEEDFHLYLSHNTKGYAIPYDFYGRPYFEPYERKDTEEETPFDPLMEIYLNKIKYLCDERNIRFLLVSIPANDMDDGQHNRILRYAEENNIRYINLGEKNEYEKLNIISPLEIANAHSNFFGANKITRYIGDLLSEEYSIPKVSDEQWERTKDYYHQLTINELATLG